MSEVDPLAAWIQAHRPAEAELQAFEQSARLLAEASPLSRSYCPSREDLIAPVAALGVTLGLARERHVTACPLCRSDLADYRELCEVPVGALESLRAQVSILWDRAGAALRLLESGLAPAPAPALALRGDAAPSVLALRAALGAGELRLTWAPGADGLDLLAEASGGAPLAYRLDLSSAGALVESRSADAAGRVRLLGLAPGSYQLEVALALPEGGEPALVVDLALEALEAPGALEG